MSKPVILTGLRANSDLHLGNYLGGILPMVEMQKKHAGEYQINMFVPDLHSFTTPIDHKKLYEQTIENLKIFVASGLDISNEDTFVYRQSFIPAHSELTWILGCFTGMGELERMTQYKDKSQVIARQASKESLEITDEASSRESGEILAETIIKIHERIVAGLLYYPVLMASDILLYGAKYVPVGEDQRQHIELTRDLAIRMNNKFGNLFVVPEEWSKQVEFANRDNGVRIRSLRNPDKKMSKSVEDPAGTIKMTDNPAEAAKKVMSATTDSEGSIAFDMEKRPGVSNLLQILALLSNTPQSEVNSQWSGKNSYGDLKSAVASQVESFLTEFQKNLSEVDEAKLLQKLEDDEKTMNSVANKTLHNVQVAVGLRK